MKAHPLAIYVATFFVGLTPFFMNPSVPESAETITIAVRLTPAGQIPTSNSPRSEDALLPDDWRTHETLGVEHRYEIRFEAPPAQQERLAVMVPSVRQNARLYLNDTLLGDGGRFDAPVARNTRRPLFFALPTEQLLAGENTITVDVKTGADMFGFLSQVYVGPEKDLRAFYDRTLFFRVTLAAVIAAIVVFVSLFFIVLWFYQRRRTEYAFFGLSGLSFAVFSFSFLTVNLPVSEKVWELYVCITLGAFAYLAAVLYVHRALGRNEPRVERAILAVAGAILVAILLAPDVWPYRISYFVWTPFCVLMGVYGLLRTLVETRKLPGNEVHWIAASGALVLAYGLHDAGLFVGLLDWSRGQFVPYAISLVVVWHGLVLMSRLVSTSRELETLNANLERTIDERTQTLQRTFDELRASEEARVLSDERHRIMADMHDGVGGQLVSALTILRSNQNASPEAVASLEFALEDLRSVIDSMDASPNDLGALLELMRDRFEPSMKARGIELRWQVGELGGPKDFKPEHALNLLRILQECFSNALKHSEATQITLKASEDSLGKLTIDFRDNGKGFDTAGKRGRGMDNLERRAKAIAVILLIESHTEGDDRGTLVRLSV